MIGFFRRIRKKLADDNQFLKYSRYAIGEIVLVMVGILLALQVNNWNVNRNETALEMDILKEVRNGLETDLSDAKYNLGSQKIKLRSQQIIINWLEGNGSFQDSLSTYINTIHYGTYFQSNESPYQTLKQLGMRTIKNDSLRNQITSLYDLHYEQYHKYNVMYEQLIDNLISEAANYFNKIDYFGDTTKPINTNELKLNNRYIFYLKTSLEFNEILINQTIPNVIGHITKTMKMIDAEIKK